MAYRDTREFTTYRHCTPRKRGELKQAVSGVAMGDRSYRLKKLKIEESVMLKKFRIVVSLLLILGFSATLVGKEETNTYFPHALGSYWVYEDQNGSELTRHAMEGKEIEGETSHAFSYEPILEDWADYDYRIQPNAYQVDEEWVTFLVADHVKKAVKARLTKEIEVFRKAFVEVMASLETNVDMLYEIEVETQDTFYILPTSVTFNEKWDATQIKAKITMTPEPLIDPGEVTLNFTIVETGKVLGTENVETSAGTFENCLKIEYRTETGLTTSPQEESNPPGESVTTLWLAPNVGIVKFHQEAENVLLTVIPLPEIKASTTVKTLELKKYEVKSTNSGSE